MVYSPTQHSDVWRQCNVRIWQLSTAGYCVDNASGSHWGQRGKKNDCLAIDSSLQKRVASRALKVGTLSTTELVEGNVH